MNKYHIGTRIRGFAKRYLKEIKQEINPKDSEKYVPHLTLIVPFTTNNEKRLIETFQETCFKQREIIPFTIENFGTFYNPEKIFYANILENAQIENLIKSLKKSLDGKITYIEKEISDYGEKNLHLTIIKGIPKETTISKLKSVGKIDQYLLRIYILKNKLILNEYDFCLEKLLTREEAKNEEIFNETISAFKQKTGLIQTPEGFVKINS